MKKNIKENLEFQKNNFPKIYNSYLNNNLSEVAITNENIDFEYTQKEYIQIITDEVNKVVFDLFKIPIYEFESINLSDYKEIHLIKDINTSIEEYGHILEIKYCYPYILKVKKIIISQTIKKDDIENRINIIVLKKLTIFENSYLKNYLHIVTQMSGIDELNQYLINYKSKYNLQRFLLKKVEYNKLKINQIDQYYENMIIGKLIDIAMHAEGDNDYIIVEALIKYINNIYQHEILNLLGNFMTDKFVTNFRLVEIYITSKDNFIDIINKKYNKSLQVYINNISSKKESEKIALLLDGKLKELEKLFINSINNFIADLKKIGDE